jgi:poly-gamma-glutamate synthesis protein (capsule biosynthesis protein)
MRLLLVLLLAGSASASADELTLNVVGDISYSDGAPGVDEVDAKGTALFADVQPVLDGADLDFANLECAFTQAKATVKKTYPQVCDPKRLAYVIGAKFNLFSLANNHSLDAGVAGASDTRAAIAAASTKDHPLWAAGTGDATSVRFTIKGQPISFFAVTGGTPEAGVASLSSPDLDAGVKAARAAGDLVLVSVHNGPEYIHVPDADTVSRYHALIDEGATAVIAHHPHVVQGVERYGAGVIFYSLGNFSFGSKTLRNLETGARMFSMIGQVTFSAGKLQSVRVLPLWVDNWAPWKIGDRTIAPKHASPQRLDGDFFDAAAAAFSDFAAAVPGASPTALTPDAGWLDVAPAPQKIAVKHPEALIPHRVKD